MKSFSFFSGLQLLVLKPKVVKCEDEAPSLKALIMDPYILIAAGKGKPFSYTMYSKK